MIVLKIIMLLAYAVISYNLVRAFYVAWFRGKAYFAFIFANAEREKIFLPPLKCNFPSFDKMLFSFKVLKYSDYFDEETLKETQL